MNVLRPRNAAWQRICDWYKIRDGYWFAPKLYGYGATPVRWQAWALIAGLILAGLGDAWLAVRFGPAMYALIAPLIVGFIYLAWAKTDGEWRWRWGADR